MAHSCWLVSKLTGNSSITGHFRRRKYGNSFRNTEGELKGQSPGANLLSLWAKGLTAQVEEENEETQS